MAKYLRYKQGDVVGYGRLSGGTIHPIEGQIGDFRESPGPPLQLSDAQLLAPTEPTKIIAIGPNCRCRYDDEHPPPSQPSVWVKPLTCLNDPEGIVQLPSGHLVIHEVELAMVIGKEAKDVEISDARDYIFGYTCTNDLTAIGDLSRPGKFADSHYLVDGKVFDTFAPIGPYIETDLDVSNLHLESRLNGEVRQSHSTADFLFSPDFIVAMISHMMTLLPGDVISMGSPPGAGPIHVGDTVEVEIENIGVLRNYARDRG